MKKKGFYCIAVLGAALALTLAPCKVSSFSVEDMQGTWAFFSELPSGAVLPEIITIFTISQAAIIFSDAGYSAIGLILPRQEIGGSVWEIFWIFRRAPGKPRYNGRLYWYTCTMEGDPETPAMTGTISWQGRDNATKLQGYKAHELSVFVSPEQGGTVAFVDENLICATTDYERYYFYRCQGQTTLTAKPAGGWSFKQWKYGVTTSSENPLTLTIDDDKQVTAVFEREPDNKIVFKDPKLEEAIRNRLDKPSGDIYKSDLEKLDWLVLDGGGIIDLSGIEYCVNLTQLTVRYNEVTDIAPVAALTKIENLYIEYTPVQDISAVAGLTGLKRLYLDNNKIADITPVKDLTGLEYLFIDNNLLNDTTRLQNIDALSKLKKMLKLSMGNNQITNISALAGMTDLIYLDINTNQINDISPLKGLTEVEILWAENNQISDISAVAGWTIVNTLDFSYNQVMDISVMADLSTLQFVFVDANQISDISALVANQGLGQGDSLSIAGNLLNHNCDPTKGDTTDCDNIEKLKARGVNVVW
jgi:Leucine-rich repeat (LRR) protein